MGSVSMLERVWRAYVTCTWPVMRDGKEVHLERPNWKWYAEALSKLPELPNTLPSGAVRVQRWTPPELDDRGPGC